MTHRRRLSTVEPEGAKPTWSEQNVPLCTEECPSHDGKRCKLIGVRAPNICEPTVSEMARALFDPDYDECAAPPTGEGAK